MSIILLDDDFTENDVKPTLKDEMSFQTMDGDRVLVRWPKEVAKTCRMPRMKRNYPCARPLKFGSLFCKYHHDFVKKRGGLDTMKYCTSCGNWTNSARSLCDGCDNKEIREREYRAMRRDRRSRKNENKKDKEEEKKTDVATQTEFSP